MIHNLSTWWSYPGRTNKVRDHLARCRQWVHLIRCWQLGKQRCWHLSTKLHVELRNLSVWYWNHSKFYCCSSSLGVWDQHGRCSTGHHNLDERVCSQQRFGANPQPWQGRRRLQLHLSTYTVLPSLCWVLTSLLAAGVSTEAILADQRGPFDSGDADTTSVWTHMLPLNSLIGSFKASLKTLWTREHWLWVATLVRCDEWLANIVQRFVSLAAPLFLLARPPRSIEENWLWLTSSETLLQTRWIFKLQIVFVWCRFPLHPWPNHSICNHRGRQSDLDGSSCISCPSTMKTAYLAIAIRLTCYGIVRYRPYPLRYLPEIWRKRVLTIKQGNAIFTL